MAQLWLFPHHNFLISLSHSYSMAVCLSIYLSISCNGGLIPPIFLTLLFYGCSSIYFSIFILFLNLKFIMILIFLVYIEYIFFIAKQFYSTKCPYGHPSIILYVPQFVINISNFKWRFLRPMNIYYIIISMSVCLSITPLLLLRVLF